MIPVKPLSRLVLAVLLCWLSSNLPANAQTQSPPAKEDVVRVFTELVQTDVMVFTKDGQFVNGLRREDFELKIDGKSKPIEFFERITAGSINEEAQLAAARGGSANPVKSVSGGAVPLDRGRVVFFYVDDVHLDQSGIASTRNVISRFIEREMGQNDEAAITCASGQVGFLGQLTENRTVLRAALERLRPRTSSVTDFQRPPMSEYQGVMISRYDRDTTDYFVEVLLRENPLLSRDTATSMVRDRAQSMLMQAANFTRITLTGLENIVRASAKLPGRKVVFFISNGFFLDNQNTDYTTRIQRLTGAAARSGVVIYSMDARGLVASLVDASTDVAFDPSGRLDRGSAGELLASQDAMNALARDTGGRPFFNNNKLETGLTKALTETSTYYLLAWKPDPGAEKNARFRKIEVKLIDKNYSVRVRRGFFDVDPEPVAEKGKKPKPPEEKTPENQIRAAVNSPLPERGIPVALSLSQVNTADKGHMLSNTVQIPAEFITFGANSDNTKALVDVVLVVFDTQGKVSSSLTDRIQVSRKLTDGVTAKKTSSEDFAYNFPTFVGPGLYHVRVGARDFVSGKVGSAHGWIEVPNLTGGQLTMSSLLVGERTASSLANASTRGGSATDQVSLSVTRRFHRDSYLRFLVFVYNATQPTGSKPDVAVQTQVLRDGQPVVTTAQRKIDPEGISDPQRLPYAAEIPLADLLPGRYLLKVTVVDRTSKRSASQETRFEIY